MSVKYTVKYKTNEKLPKNYETKNLKISVS